MNVFYSEGLRVVEEALNAENLILPYYVKLSLLEILSRIGIYEEEEVRIIPRILVGKNLSLIFKQVPDHFKLVLGTEDANGVHFNKMLKSLIPLCKNGWYVFVDFCDDKIDYGIFRKFRSPVALDFEQLIFDSNDIYATDEKIGMICIRPLNKLSFVIRGLHMENFIISSCFIAQDDIQEENALFNMLLEDIIGAISIDDKMWEYIKNAMNHILHAFNERIHGAILLIVTEEFQYPNDYLDGLMVVPPINFVNNIVDTQMVEVYETAEKYYAVSNLLYDFLNIDGITIMNNKGEVIGYNAFYRSDSMPMDVVGGARKRTFEGLKRVEDKNIVGIYYQSQDGNKQYCRR